MKKENIEERDNGDNAINWNSPKHICVMKDRTTKEKYIFTKNFPYIPSDKYIVHNNRFGPDCEFGKEVMEENTSTRAEIIWNYDLDNGAGKEKIEIHIQQKDEEDELLDGLITKTEEALEIMKDRKAFLNSNKTKKAKE